MSVIAKMMVRGVVNFGTGTYVDLSCICENDLMAAYATDHQDKLFTRYSPFGEIRLHQAPNWSIFAKSEEHVQVPAPPPAFYVVLLEKEGDEPPAFDKASTFLEVNCHSKTKYAGDGSRVELREPYGLKTPDLSTISYRAQRRYAVQKLSWKMHVDNPPAEDQFIPGKNYWLAFYDAEKYDMHAALGDAHT